MRIEIDIYSLYFCLDMRPVHLLKFVYSEKATKFCKISILLLSTVHIDKSKVEISQNFVDFSEYMNFKAVETILVGIFVFIESLNMMLKNTTTL